MFFLQEVIIILHVCSIPTVMIIESTNSMIRTWGLRKRQGVYSKGAYQGISSQQIFMFHICIIMVAVYQTCMDEGLVQRRICLPIQGQLLFHLHTKMLTTREEHSYSNLSPQYQVVTVGVAVIQAVAMVVLSWLFLSCSLYSEVSTLDLHHAMCGREMHDNRTISKG